jgi:hypothetical protein
VGDPSATARFQALGLIHSVLSKPEMRALYDESGDIEEDDGCELSTEWYLHIDGLGLGVSGLGLGFLFELLAYVSAHHIHQPSSIIL